MEFLKNHSLRPYNTFGIDVQSNEFVNVQSLEDVQSLIKEEYFQNQPLILGGGSNILFTKDYEGVVIKNDIKGIDIITEDDQTVTIAVKGGEVWHELVLHTVDQGWGGIENMSLIPGTVGAAPIQNIGAYGVEVKDVITEVIAINLSNGELETFNNEACQFGYRMSTFKSDLKGKYFIYEVRLQLSKQATVNVSYGAITSTLEKEGITQPSIKDVSNAVIAIRQSKLPDPAEIGNSGSFFKNPVIAKSHFEEVQAKFPEIVHYPVNDQEVKVPAGWLIEQCGWKGKVVGNTGCHKNQALVLVNYGNANGTEVHKLALAIQKSVKDKFTIDIYPEVNII